ncbi:carbohydrate ABC transporter permease [Paenibacillus sp. P26]|nr:carbohydrate ABC transporter permease [Paenibacillus sp. P26]
MLTCGLRFRKTEIPGEEYPLYRDPQRTHGAFPGRADSEFRDHEAARLAGHVLRPDCARYLQRFRDVPAAAVFYDAPSELDEAAKIDGCTYFGIYLRIFLPLSKAALVSLAIFTILASWNDLLWPLIMTSSDEMRVLTIGIASFQGQHGTDYPLLMAGALMATSPMILMFTVFQRYFIEGIAMNGIKG